MDPAALTILERIAVRPVQEPTEIIPLVQTSYRDAIPHAQRHASSEVYVVRHEERLPITDVDNESLVRGAVVVIGEKAADEASDFDPPPIIAFRVANVSPPSQAPSSFRHDG